MQIRDQGTAVSRIPRDSCIVSLKSSDPCSLIPVPCRLDQLRHLAAVGGAAALALAAVLGLAAVVARLAAALALAVILAFTGVLRGLVGAGVHQAGLRRLH